ESEAVRALVAERRARLAITGEAVNAHALLLQRRLLRSDLFHWMMVLGLLAGAGGLGAERGRGTAIFSASLPYARRTMLLTRFVAGALVVIVGAASTGIAM